MIKKMTIQNFKSIKHQEVCFQGVNLIIGANNSGKSNLLDGLFTIQNIFRYPIKDAFGRGPYSYGATFCKGGDKDAPMLFKLDGDLSSKLYNYEIKIKGKWNGKFFSPFIDEETLQWNGKKYNNQDKEKSLIYTPGFLTKPDDIKDFKWALKTKKYQFVPKLIKEEHAIADLESESGYGGSSGFIPFLSYNGGNLLDVLYYIREYDVLKFSEIIKDCQKFFPNLKDIRIQTGMGAFASIQVTMKLGKESWKFNGVHLSDGFAIILAIVTLLNSEKLPNIILIEELENGLNPASIEKVLTKLFEVSSKKGVQFIISTHSPVFLQLLRKNPESVIICEQNKEGHSEYIPLDKKLELFKEDYERGDSLIDLWLAGLIGGL